MKFGCLYVRCTDNIGDDIQTYAQAQFLPQIDYYIDRETLKVFHSEAHEPVACIMNAWYMNQPLMAWPPSQDIIPLLTSVHFDSRLDGYWAKNQFARSYLEKHAPIGCRDTTTLQKLQSMRIPSYYSGCMTLTLKGWEDIERQDYICLVNVSESVEKYFASLNVPYRIISQQNESLVDISIQERLKAAESLLRLYQSAKCVVTSRLHCALPCLALKTPVLVEYRDDFKDRFAGLSNLLRLTSAEEICKGKWDAFFRSPEKNKTFYLALRESLIEQCCGFVDNVNAHAIKTKAFDEIEQQKYYQDILMNLSDLYKANRPFWENWYNAVDISRMEENAETAWNYVRCYEKDMQLKQQECEQAWEYVKKYEKQVAAQRNQLNAQNREIIQLKRERKSK